MYMFTDYKEATPHYYIVKDLNERFCQINEQSRISEKGWIK